MGNYLDLFLFAILPYLSLTLFFVETIRRYNKQMYSYTSLSSQFLENKEHFWGLVPFHYGILTVLVGHVLAFLLPKQLLLWNSYPIRLYILETTALIFGLLALIGIITVIHRRMTHSKVKVVTCWREWMIYSFLLLLIASGIDIAIMHRWGSEWFASVVSPYLWSLLKFNPDISLVLNLPLVFKIHMITAFLLIGVFPFTKLVHVLVIPNHYFFRKRQVVRWYGIQRYTEDKK